tara:strand:+ start:442 stop:789 length:348 start_codon:yes stop_codon:yes gene_type:complete
MKILNPINVLANDYTTRTYTVNSCKLFAEDAYQASDTFRRGIVLEEILNLIENAPVAGSIKHRAFQAVQLVWKNQIDNPSLAYSLAMGLCLKPKQKMAPIDDLWVTSPRTSREFF